MNEATLKQAAHLLTLIAQKGTPLGQLQLIYNRGLLADLLDGNIEQVNRDEFLKVLGLNPTIHVDRSVRLVYPHEQTAVHDELQAAGPAQYRINEIEQWCHPDQKGEGVTGNVIYEYLKNNEMLGSCLGLHDLKAIQNQNLAFFRRYFKGKRVFGWKSVTRSSDGRTLGVPCLFEDDEVVILTFLWVGGLFCARDPVLRFVRPARPEPFVKYVR